ncbi:Golgi transport complex subunit 3 [Coemansia linderi]|uniref:Golgi transport complex subunit 3 n=1 Tax=Coemansia linderi TaxID=2663919 RepID=A0ACC1KNM0_9FUNG|nr:Golgi transport complex subunit 3 [Coemansia linderi]
MTSVDDWDKRFPVSEGLRPGIALLQDMCASFNSQLLVQPPAIAVESSEATTPVTNGVVDKPTLGGKLNPQLQFLRGSPQLSARRNASLRNLTVLARAASPRLRPAVAGTTELGALGILNGGDTEPPLTAGGVMGAMETPAQFLEWYGRVEETEAAGQDAEALAFASQLRERVSQCSQMLGCLDEISSLLSEMEADYQRVCQQTAGVESACASLGSQRDRLDQVASEIGEQLAVYNWLAPITRLLHAPGDRVCEDPEFLPSLDRTEEAIRFIESRVEESKDGELYLMRFAQCRMRALSLIKMHALRAFKALGGFDAKGSAVYVHYSAAAVGLGPLLRALQQRATEATERQVLSDVQNAYFATRRAWLRPHVQTHLRDIAAEHEAEKEMPVLERRVGALRDWCAFMMAVCADECRLYRDFFNCESDGEAGLLRSFLDSAMTLFHEQVRPLIIHESDVAVLAGISLTLMTYSRLPPSSSEDDGTEEEEEEEKEEAEDVDGLDAFYAVVGQVLEDTQHRLAYKAQSFIRANIGSYRITPPDTEAMAKWVHVCLRLRIADPAQLSALLGAPEDLLPEDAECLQWIYPPVDNCRWLIAQIDGCLDYEVQSGVVDEARTACKQNLLGTGARFVRDSSIKSENPITDAESELMAHLFATHNLAAIEGVIS